MKRSIKLYVEDIMDSITKIEKYIKGISSQDFIKDTKTIDAIIRNLEVIGEASKNIPETVKAKYPDIPWKEIKGLRNKITHEYFGVDCEIVWQIVNKDLPELKSKIKRLAKIETAFIKTL